MSLRAQRSNLRAERSVHVSLGDGCMHGRFQAMASPCEVLCEVSEHAAAQRLTKLAADEAWRIEDKFSRYLADNIVHRINRAAGAIVTVDPETSQLIDFAVTLFKLSDGGFDITSGGLRRVWSFDGSDNVPSASVVAEAMQTVGWDKVCWSPPELRIPAGMEIDLGGIGKEYAVDRAADILRRETDASCLVNFGGDLAVTSVPVNMPAWTVGVESLTGTSTPPASLLKLRVGALATSGDARRYLMKNGVRYSHILDPRTGWPVPGAPRSVTVAADTCTQAGMLCTLAMLQGVTAENFLELQGVKYWCSR